MASNPKHSKKKVKKRRSKLLIFFVALLSVFGVLLVGVGTLLWQFRYQYVPLDHFTDSDLGIDSSNASLNKEITNIALFGIDTRNRNSLSGNSDSIMIISIDQIHNKVKITSIMRDTLVYSDKYGYCKINSLYPKGVDASLRTLNQLFNMNIRHYATVNFAGMAEIIDVMGGIEVDVTEAERNDANVHIKYTSKDMGTPCDYIKKAGLQTLNGIQAVCYARIRHVSTSDGVRDDFGRTDRQRYVMEQLFNKVMTMEKSKYPALIKTLLPYMETSLGYSDIISLAGILAGDVKFEQTRIPMHEYLISGDYRQATGSSTVYYNFGYASKILHAFIYDDILPEAYIEANGVDKTDWVNL